MRCCRPHNQGLDHSPHQRARVHEETPIWGADGAAVRNEDPAGNIQRKMCSAGQQQDSSDKGVELFRDENVFDPFEVA